MSSEEAEAPKAAPSSQNFTKIILILAGGALLLSLVNTVLLVLNPTAGKVEQFNESLKSDLAESVATIHKKIDGLRSAEVEWQSVLKKSSEKPDAVYKIVKSEDGLSLVEVSPAAPEAAAAH